jgi:hypothetical protein
MRRDLSNRVRRASQHRSVVVLCAALTAILAAPSAARAQPMGMSTCPSGATCAYFFSQPNLAGNIDARDIPDSRVCIPLGSITESVRNDTPRPLALYSGRCAPDTLLAVVSAGAALAEIPGSVQFYASVTCSDASVLCFYAQPGFVGPLEVADAEAPAGCRPLSRPAASARNLSTTGRRLSLFSGTTCSADELVATIPPGGARPTLSHPAVSVSW